MPDRLAGHNLGLLMRQLIGAGTPKEAVARGGCVLVLLLTVEGAAAEALILVLVANRVMPALIVLTMGLGHQPDGTSTSSAGCYAWNRLTDQPWLIMSIGLRDWANA